METTIDLESFGATSPARRRSWWPWAALGFGAAVVIVGGMLFTPSAGPHPAPADCQAQCAMETPQP